MKYDYQRLQVTYMNKRARRKGAEGFITPKQWLSICEYYGHQCVSCKQKTKLTIDHIIPLSKNGSNWPINLQPLCLTCNAGKHGRIIDYRWSIPDFIDTNKNQINEEVKKFLIVNEHLIDYD